jgi:hypothetical protein
MSTPEEIRRQERRERQAKYDQRDDRKEIRRMMSIAKSKERKLATTDKRFRQHSVDELMSIARSRCIEDGIDFEANRVQIEAVLRILHGRETI